MTIEELKALVEELKGKITDLTLQLKAVEGKAGKDEVTKLREEIDEKRNELSAKQEELEEEILALKRKGLSGSNDDKSKAVAALASFARGDVHALNRESDNRDGGYLVPVEISSDIEKLVGDQSAMRSIADVRNTGMSSVKMHVRVGKPDGGWVGEAVGRTEKDGPKYEEVVIDVHTLYTEPKVTEEILDDIDTVITSEIVDSTVDALTELEGDAFINGDGVKKPRGLLSYDTKVGSKVSDFEWGKVLKVKTGKSGELGTNQIAAFYTAKNIMRRTLKPSCVWLMNSNTATELEKLKDENGRPLWSPSIREDRPDMFLGFPIEIDDFMPDISAGGIFAFFIAKKKAYAIRDRIGLMTKRDDLTEKGFVKFYTRKRVGGGIKNFQALVGISAEA